MEHKSAIVLWKRSVKKATPRQQADEQRAAARCSKIRCQTENVATYEITKSKNNDPTAHTNTPTATVMHFICRVKNRHVAVTKRIYRMRIPRRRPRSVPCAAGTTPGRREPMLLRMEALKQALPSLLTLSNARELSACTPSSRRRLLHRNKHLPIFLPRRLLHHTRPLSSFQLRDGDKIRHQR